jgi:O-antigen/teichoic acid export membrane protein
VKTYERAKERVERLLRGDGLRAKAARGGAWLGSASLAEQVSRFARNMFLARLLAPSAFGAMAIVLSSSSLITSFTDVGVLPAIIHNPRGGDRAYLNAAWWLGMTRALFIYVLIFAASPWISRFYGNADLAGLLRVAMLSTVLDGLISPRAKLAHKEMKFSRWALISNGGAICGVILTIALSLILRDVWALAIGYCSENAFRCVLSYIVYPGLPSLEWDRRASRDLLMFSKGMVGLSFLNLIFARADIFVLGKLYSPAMLGIYALAVNLIQTPSSFLINTLNQTLLPALSHVQDEPGRANRILIEVTFWVMLLGLPVVAMIWLCGSSLLTVTYGARYATASQALAVAAAVTFLNTLNSLVTSLFFAAGRPALHRRAVFVSAVTMLLVVYPACKHLGIAGGQLAALIAITGSYLLQVLRARDVTGLSILRYFKPLMPASLVSAGILAIGMSAHLLGLGTRPLASISVAVAACIIGCALGVPLFTRRRDIRSESHQPRCNLTYEQKLRVKS